jgi:hypothetical protein
MQITPVINALEATLMSHATIASSDPAVESAVTQLVAALAPALHMAAMDIADGNIGATVVPLLEELEASTRRATALYGRVRAFSS